MSKPLAQKAVKDLGMVVDMTPEQHLELIQCMNDPIYFMKNFVWVIHGGTAKKVLLELYPCQHRIVEGFQNNRFVAVLTSRQSGKSTITMAYLLWRAMFCENTGILVTGNTLAAARQIMKRIRMAYENCPDHIRDGVKEYNKDSIQFENNSWIECRATGPDSTRGLSPKIVFADEFAFIPLNLQSDFYSAIEPTTTTGGSFFITSTPKSDVDIFAQIWRDAINQKDEYGNPTLAGEGVNGYHPVKIMYDEIPGQEGKEWRETKIKKIGIAKFRQEYGCEFVTDDETLLNPLWLVNAKGTQPEFFTMDRKVRWYVEPLPNIAYFISLDPSGGTGRDDAAIQVFGFPDLGQVAEWQHDQSDPRTQFKMLMHIALCLDTALREHPDQISDPEIYWSWEANGLGQSISDIVTDVGEERVKGELVNERRVRGMAKRRLKGMVMSNTNKRNASMKLKSMIETGKMPIRSQNLIDQFKNFVSKGDTYAAKIGAKDDLVMATVIGTRVLTTLIAKGYETAETMKETIEDDELLGADSETDNYGAMPMVF